MRLRYSMGEEGPCGGRRQTSRRWGSQPGGVGASISVMALDLTTYPDAGYVAERREPADIADQRRLRKWEAAIGYRIFGHLRWGQLGDGHITARDPELTDHFWVLNFGVPFRTATMDDLVLVDPEGAIVDGPAGARVNHAAVAIHRPLFDSRPGLVSAAHTHTPYGTPWSAMVEPFVPLSQESCAFVFDQSLYEGEDLEVLTFDGGYRIAEVMGDTRLCILRNHGLVTGAGSPAVAVGWFVMAERVAEVHVKAGERARPISVDAAKEVAVTMAEPRNGWRSFLWLARDLVPDPTVVL